MRPHERRRRIHYAAVDDGGRDHAEDAEADTGASEDALAVQYVEFMKGLQRGFVPKRCANCGRWFLQAPGATFAYCTGSAPADPGKTCREIGAVSSFKDKVANNEVWQVQQRAYKKYYARTMRKDMTKAEFEAWTHDAEQKRDAALEPYARAESEEERQRIAAELEEKLNRL